MGDWCKHEGGPVDEHTDTNGESDEAQAGNGVLDEVGPAGTQEGGSGAVVLAVVGGVEAVNGRNRCQYVLTVLS